MTDRGQKIKEAFLKKYGVSHPSQLPHVKEKIKKKRELGAYSKMVEKMQNTKLEKYGDENYNNIEKGKVTKLEKYGDENYNNRDKLILTNQQRYGMNVSPNTVQSTKLRSASGEIGFKSDSYKTYLSDNKIQNVSQLENVKIKKRAGSFNKMVNRVFHGDRLKHIVTPLFDAVEYLGTGYDLVYKFKCATCNSEFLDNLYSGNIPRCVKCYPYATFSSSIEDEICSFLESNNIKIKRHDRTVLDGNEIDILLQNNSLAIECNGIYWHSEVSGKKDKQYHLNKTIGCKKKGIELLHIMDWEWRCKRKIVESMILNKLGNSIKIYGRKCIVKEIDSDTKDIFLIENHMQGEDISSIRLGLFYENSLISIMTFVKSRFDKKCEYELSRFCNKLNHSIVGGSSKLFKHFIRHYPVNSIVTYSDKRFFSGAVYLNMGMTQQPDTPPGYHYFDKNKMVPINRGNFQKHKLKKILPTFDSALTEWENMQLNGYDRIWDCGHLKYTWIRQIDKK